MAKSRRSKGKSGRRGREATHKLPPGVKLFRTLEGHQDAVRSVAFDPAGGTLASGSRDGTVKLWEVGSGKLLRTLEGQRADVRSVAFDPKGGMLASGAEDGTVKLWETRSGWLLRTLKGHGGGITGVAFDPQRGLLASGSRDNTVKLWEARSGKLLRTLEGHDWVQSVAFDPQGVTLASAHPSGTVSLWKARTGKLLRTLKGHQKGSPTVEFDPRGGTLASGSYDNTVKLWEVDGKLLHTLEGHTGVVEIVAFSADARLLASKSRDHTIRLWNSETWDTVAIIPEPTGAAGWISALAFHPTEPLLAAAGSEPNTPDHQRSRLIHLGELDLDVLLGKPAGVAATARAVHHTTGKIVLVGDHSVGKSALGYHMIHGEFKKQASTHGQQFWVFPALGKRRRDGTECEAILWDFAGQPDYRLVHALFVDDADLALVLFDASDLRDPLHGVGFWLKQLQSGESRCPIILVPAQTDRGSCTLTPEELQAFCRRHGIVGPIATSAFTGEGLPELVERMKSLIPWEDKPATVTTTTFKRIKDYVLDLKETETDGPRIVTPKELRRRLEASDADWSFTDAEMLTAVGHLENYGYVKKLRTSQGEERVLLAPELLNNLASSFVLEARRNPKGLGSLEEKRLLAGGYPFRELEGLTQDEQDTLLDSAALLFIEHNVCFRETDPLTQQSYLVFPELINLKKPILEDERPIEDGVAYTVSGATENVFASLVVLLGYTRTFTRTNQWRNHARYEVGDGLVCGFRQEGERDGELDFVLYFCRNVSAPVRMLFQSLFENFLARRNLAVMRYEPVTCSKGHQLNRAVVREALQHGEPIAFCSKCGERLALPRAEPIQLTQEEQAIVDAQRRVADQRTRFEQAIFRVQNYATEKKIKVPECFISYAWGVKEHERWVEKLLAKDLQKAGIKVVLDRWENARIGASIMRFVERIDECGFMIVVGTPLYRQKAKNVASETGSVVAAEYDLAGIRLLGTEGQKQEVLPVLLDGDPATALPPLLRGRVRADFRKEEEYFVTAFDLILSLYGIAPSNSAVADLRESLREPRMR